MRTILMTAVLTFMVAMSGSPVLADNLVRFKGGIGVIPVSNVVVPATGTFTSFSSVRRNVVQGVPPAGQPWVIARFKATVHDDGTVSAKGKGLLLAGGNGIGTNANASVFLSLFCGGIERHTTLAGVPLDPDGDFKIEDSFTETPPSPCTSPVLLIRAANGGPWFAAGIPQFKDEDFDNDMD